MVTVETTDYVPEWGMKHYRDPKARAILVPHDGVVDAENFTINPRGSSNICELFNPSLLGALPQSNTSILHQECTPHLVVD